MRLGRADLGDYSVTADLINIISVLMLRSPSLEWFCFLITCCRAGCDVCDAVQNRLLDGHRCVDMQM